MTADMAPGHCEGDGRQKWRRRYLGTLRGYRDSTAAASPREGTFEGEVT